MMCGVLYFQQEGWPLTVHASFILFGNNFTVYATIFILIFFIFFMLQDSWWRSRVDGCKNSPSFASSSSAPSPSHGSSPPEQGTSTKSPQISNILSNNLSSSSLPSTLARKYLLPHLFVFVLLLLLLSDNIKEQHSVFKRVARLCRLWGQWLLHDNLAKKCNVTYSYFMVWADFIHFWQL